MMTIPRVLWLPWVLVGMTAVLAVMESVVNGGSATAGSASDAPSWLGLIELTALSLVPLSFAGVGAFILTRRPNHRVGWLMIAFGLGFALGTFATDYPQPDAATHNPTRPFGLGVAWVETWAWKLEMAALLLLLLLFPTGKLPSPRWKPVVWMGVPTLLVYGVIGAVARGPISDVPVENPIGIVAIPGIVIGVAELIALACLAAAALSLVVRFRTAGGIVRQQVKWLAFGASIAITLNVAAAFFSWNSFVGFCAIVADLALPVCISIAILRYRLYDIDVLINRALVYSSLTISLAALYAGGVLGLQALFRILTHQSSDLAVALSTLAVVVLFNPLRHRVQAFIDRRFYRRKYDAARILTEFQSTLRNEVDLDRLSRELVHVVHETVQPTRVSLWLR